ncbi:MAG TPA: DUF6230 family protein [Actinomycetota bacterium]|nr:DUF6230 family protein [Actinomycetota bacterium]
MGVIVSVLVLAATGAIALPLTIAGPSFTVAGDALHGTGFSQYGSVEQDQFGHPHAIGVTTIDNLTDGSGNGIVNLLQTVCGPTGIPVASLSNLTMVITGDSVTATNLVAGVTDLTTAAGVTTAFNNLVVGVPLGPVNSINPALGQSLGQTADSFDIGGPFTQTAISTTAGTFMVKHLALHVHFSSSC